MYILKLVFCICILEISVYIGIILGKQLKNRTKEYLTLQSICTYIEGRIKYSQDNLIDIFYGVYNQNSNNSFGELFNNIANQMEKNTYSLSECVSSGITNNQYRFNCDFNILQELSNSLGKSNVENQLKAIELSKDRIKEKINECKEVENRNTRLYRILGVICGIMLVIVLI